MSGSWKATQTRVSRVRPRVGVWLRSRSVRYEHNDTFQSLKFKQSLTDFDDRCASMCLPHCRCDRVHWAEFCISFWLFLAHATGNKLMQCYVWLIDRLCANLPSSGDCSFWILGIGKWITAEFIADSADRRFEAKEWHTPRVAVPLETNVTAHTAKV